MSKNKLKCGFTRVIHPPKKEGVYLVKTLDFEYELASYLMEEWYLHNTDLPIRILAWIKLPKTDIDTPF